jgi:hypothetical protein
MPDSSQDLSATELELKIEKLTLEIAELRRAHAWNKALGQFLPLLSALVPVLALLFAVQQFAQQQKAATAALMRQTEADTENSERTFMQPVLERQMNTYFEASAAAATIASSQDPLEVKKARDTFWRLYWGPLVMLESPEVSGAMKEFDACLRSPESCSSVELKNLSLALASSLQADFFASWKLSPEEYARRSINYAEMRRSGR